jgi:hypothetical protein
MPGLQHQGAVRATGGLMVWLWIVIVAGGLSVAMTLYTLYQFSGFSFDDAFIVNYILIVFAVLNLIGAGMLLNGLKSGFALIIVANFGALLCAFYQAASEGMNPLIAIVSAILSPLIIWLFARKQWPSFK